MQGAQRSEWSFHSQAVQRNRRAHTLQPFGLGLLWAHSGVANRLL
jgi:hypothetical protein